jgi:peptide deformylase
MITNELELRKPNQNASLEEAKSIIKELEKELSLHPGIGLAAPQIGIHKTVAIIRTGSENLDLVNPIIIEKIGCITSREEGCLSFPGKKLNVARFKEIFLKDDLHPDGIVVTGLMAIVCEHEIDHCQNILFIDKSIDNKIGRNDPCPCGNNKDGKNIKFKNCHGR